MISVKVKLKERSYDILIGLGVLSQLGKFLKPLGIGADAVIITHPGIRRRYGPTVVSALKREGFTARIFSVPDGERSKSASCAFSLFNKIASYDVKKRLFIIALGGGVVGDLAGFVAGCYKRGLPYIQVPTTLLAQIDSAIGGKVGIDLAAGKNLVGAFYQPRLVVSEVAVLSSLSLRQLRNGFAEAIKYGMIADKKLFEYLEKNRQRLLKGSLSALREVVTTCSRIKAAIVAKDEKEKKDLRTILNFGHTAAHAIEAAGGYNRYQHGEAVALGMVIAADISERLKFLSTENHIRLKHLIGRFGLPTKLQGVSLEAILEAMQHDKKFRGQRNRFVLARDIGSVRIVDDVPWEIVKAAAKDCYPSLR